MRRPETLLLALAVATTVSCAREPAPERTETPTPPATRLTSVEFLAPRDGEVLEEGSTYVIRWRAPIWKRVHVAAAMGGKDKGHLAMDLDASADSLVWQIPEGFVTGFGIARSDEVRLRLENADHPEQFMDSGPFTIIGRSEK